VRRSERSRGSFPAQAVGASADIAVSNRPETYMIPLKSVAAGLILSILGSGCAMTKPSSADNSLLLSPGVRTWGIESRKLGEDRYRIDLRQRRFAVGGDGEARQVFHRAAETLAQENGFAGYIVVSYREGIESGPLLGQRVSRGVVVLTSAGVISAAF
jgi:hypothetical protein